ncbi:ArgE/DapE family deacylase [Lacticaseibacillus thailandensis]|nr:ArgE/DapE family deacylase [Lacticaseibacillus thailandensis]
MAVPTVGQDESLVADIIEDYLQPLIASGVLASTRVNFAPGRDNLVIRYGEGTDHLLGLNGHMDVVTAGDEQQWQHAPFTATVVGGRIYGRGATDMKAGLAALVVALKRQATAVPHPVHPVVLFATVGEEVDNYGARQLAAAGYADHLEALLVGEPSEGVIKPAQRGIIDYTVTARGKAAHSSQPELGANAIDGLVAFHQAAQTAVAPLLAQTAPLLGHPTHAITLINGGAQVNIIPEAGHLRGNIRTIPTANNAQFVAALHQAVAAVNVPGVTLDLSVDSTLDPVGTPADNPLVQAVQAARAAEQLAPAPVAGDTGITDAALMCLPGTALAIYGPGNGTSHQTDEFVELADFNQALAVYGHLLAQW